MKLSRRIGAFVVVVVVAAIVLGHFDRHSGDTAAERHAACVRADNDINSIGPTLEAQSDPVQLGHGLTQLAATIRKDVSTLESSDDARRYSDQMADQVEQFGQLLVSGGDPSTFDRTRMDYLGGKVDVVCNQ